MSRGVPVLVLASLLLLSTCQPSASTTQSPSTIPVTTLSSPTASQERAGPPAPITTLPVPRVDSYERLGGLLMRKVDPATLQDLPGFSPISLGEDADLAVSPDGRSLAAILRYFDPYSNQPPSPLYLIDLGAWAIKETGVVIEEGLLAALPQFAPDGRSLWWIESQGEKAGQVLQRYSLDSQTAHRAIELRWGSTAYDFRPLGASRAAVYLLEAQAEGDGNLPPPWPRLLVVESGEVVHNLELGGVLHGWLPTGPEPDACCWNEPSLAWDVEESLLYVIHAGADTVTVVNLEDGTLERTEVRPRRSALGRLKEWLAPSALAKEEFARPSTALLSPDGSRLYVSGYAGDPDWNQPGHYLRDPQPLRVIDTDSVTELARLDLPATQIDLSPDGAWLAATGSAWEIDQSGNWQQTALLGLHVLEAGTLRPLVELDPGSSPRLFGFSPDGRHLWFGTEQADVQVLSLDRLAVIAQRSLSSSYLWRPPLPGAGVLVEHTVLCRACGGPLWPFTVPPGYELRDGQLLREPRLEPPSDAR